MIRIFTTIIVGMLILTGCATTNQEEMYKTYTATMLQANQKDQFKLELTEDGKVKSIAMSQPIHIQPYNPTPHPGWKVLDRTLSIAAPVLGTYLTLRGAADLVDAVGSGTEYNIGNNNTGTMTDFNAWSKNQTSFNTAGNDFSGTSEQITKIVEAEPEVEPLVE